MKRYMIIAIVVLLAIISSITVFAEDTMKRTDSLNVTPEEKSQLDLQNTTAQVVKKYVTGFCFIFPGTNKVDELIQSEEILVEQYLIVESNDVVSYRVLHDNKVKEIDGISSLERDNDEYFIAKMNSSKNLLSILSTDIEVYSCNYFVDTTHLGSCIYYETNMGDFVYYRGGVSTEAKEYLFPAKDFVELITSVYIARSENSDKDGGIININDYMDVSKYDMNSLSFGLEDDSSVTNEVNTEADTTEQDTVWGKKLVVYGVVSVLGIALLLVIMVISKKNKGASKNH